MTDTGQEGATTAAPPSANAGGVSLRSVSKRFSGAAHTPGALVLENITLEVPARQFVALLGPSGCGKTTLLRLIDGLIQPNAGIVSVFGAPPQPGPRIGMVFQSFRLIPWKTVRQNIEFALPGAGGQRAERAQAHIELVGLGRFADSYPAALSGGMKQRVALARALAADPDLLLMDEPFASIDAQTRELMQIELMRIWASRQSTVIFVTHSVDEAIALADRVVLLGPRPGRVVEEIAIDLPRPRWNYDLRAEPRYVALRSYLSNRLRELVLSDPGSDFYGRDLGL